MIVWRVGGGVCDAMDGNGTVLWYRVRNSIGGGAYYGMDVVLWCGLLAWLLPDQAKS